ncbi:endonuclease/exonuclease/phosphatase family protein [Xylanibacter brevis]|uniref:endonuclease/exonuclease/phosphatase family protein n=1 Tax=Xylanibacter brevis TaxID=83231 RepID=UPI0004816D1E|nr:endonuclease/exonuclease/phosphatase family protein [Xylanibacter brevis]
MILSLLLSSFLTFVELNCENLFDTSHDVGKEDSEFLPDGKRYWTRTRYWGKLNRIGQEILSCSDHLPDLVALVEVENDSVLHQLTRRSLLRNAGYEYLMTTSPDARGLDVALLYQPASFRPLCYESLEVPVLPEMRPTRDILYVQGQIITGDTLHIYVVHAPSRYGGEKETRPYRMKVAEIISRQVKMYHQERVIVTGDFNDYFDDASLKYLEKSSLVNVTKNTVGICGEAKGTYRFQGEWRSLDHFFCSKRVADCVESTYINDNAFLLDDDVRFGGKRPLRSYNGIRFQKGFSDHLPLIVKFKF